jgi:hypothetical protein
VRCSADGILYNDHHHDSGAIGPLLFRQVCLMGLEGIVSKHRDSAYRAGLSRHWIKVKNPQSPAMTRAEGRVTRLQKITLGEMRETGVRGVLVYCSDYHCSHSVVISADRWPDHLRLSDLETLFVCQACGTPPADLRPDFNWARKAAAGSRINLQLGHQA